MEQSTAPAPDYTKLNLYQKINAIQKKVTTVFKGASVSVGGGRSYNAVSHDDVAALLHIPMAMVGVFTEVDITKAEIEQISTESTYNGKTEKKFSYMAKIWVSVTFVNSDTPTERFVSNGFAYSFDNSDKATGKALSYAVKNVYLKNFNLESTDNEESRDFENNSQYQQQRGSHDNKTQTSNQSGQGNQDTKQSFQLSNQDTKQSGQVYKASANQINAIKKIYGPEYKIKEDLTSKEASELISKKN
jgi:hypothetical protein